MISVLTFPIRIAAFIVWYGIQVLLSAYAVLYDILTPGINNTPRVVRMPLESRHDAHVALIGILISLTPGTLTIGVVDSDNGARALLVHAMYFRENTEAIASLRDMERRMLHALSLGGRP